MAINIDAYAEDLTRKFLHKEDIEAWFDKWEESYIKYYGRKDVRKEKKRILKAVYARLIEENRVLYSRLELNKASKGFYRDMIKNI